MAMNICAYSSLLHPTYHPNWSYLGLVFPVCLGLNVAFIFFWLIFKWKFTAIPIVGILLCANSVYTYFPLNTKKDIPEGCIKLMSYNVMNFNGTIKTDSQIMVNPIVNYILDSKADIVCIQEGPVSGRTKLKEVLSKEYPYIQEGLESDKINVCLSKYPILDTQIIPYESKTNRSFAYKIMVGNDTLLVVNNHFESYRLHDEDKEEYKDLIKHPRAKDNPLHFDSLTSKLIIANKVRGLQVDRVAEYIDSVQCKYKIVCGDFNEPSISYSHYRLTRTLNDAYTRAGFGPGISFHENGMYFRIDNILISQNITPYQSKVDNSISESDHYPIISHLFLNEK